MKENRFLIPFRFDHTLEIQRGTVMRKFSFGHTGLSTILTANSYFLKLSPAKPECFTRPPETFVILSSKS